MTSFAGFLRLVSKVAPFQTSRFRCRFHLREMMFIRGVAVVEFTSLCSRSFWGLHNERRRASSLTAERRPNYSAADANPHGRFLHHRHVGPRPSSSADVAP